MMGGRPGGLRERRGTTCSRRERARTSGGTLRRLLGRLRPERLKLDGRAVARRRPRSRSWCRGPRILGNATNVLFDGVVGKRLPPGTTKAQAIALLRAHGHSQIADMVAGMNVTPGQRRRHRRSSGRILGLAALVYLLGAALQLRPGLHHGGSHAAHHVRAAPRRRGEAGRLPLRYFDSHPHGDILSRVTNDIDNLTTTLQQGLSQLLTSMLTIVGVMGMMFWISPLLAAVSLSSSSRSRS